jgi:hypothetical protein
LRLQDQFVRRAADVGATKPRSLEKNSFSSI